MTITVDFDALQAAQGVKVTLLQNEQAGPLVTGTDYADFSDFASVELRVDARLLNGNRGTPALTVTVQHSDDGDSWSTAQAFTFGVGGDGVQTASVSSPKAHFRALAVAARSEWLVRYVTAAPAVLNTPSGDSPGGATPGTMVAAIMEFTETAGGGTYTASVDLPAGARLYWILPMVGHDWDDASMHTVISDESGMLYEDDFGTAPDLLWLLYDEDAATWRSDPGRGGAGVLYPSGQTITAVTTTVDPSGNSGRLMLTFIYFTSLTVEVAVKS